MKKLIKILVVLAVLLVIAVGVGWFYIGSIIKAGVETVGPKVTGVSMKLDSAHLSLLGGSGGMNGLIIGNPEGYKTESAVKVGKVSLVIQPGSVLSEKIVVRSIVVNAPEITLEGGLQDNNLTKIQKNIEAFTGGAKPAGDKKGETKPAGDKPDQSAGKKLQVDEFLISGAKVTVALSVLGGQPTTLTIPDIKFTGLGSGPDGITAGELSQRAIRELLAAVVPAVTKKISESGGKAIESLGKDAGKAASDAAGKAIGELFKKK